MNNVQIKYEKLDPSAQREVDKLINSLLKKPVKQFDMTAYKERIKNISVWSDEDVKVFEENRKLFNIWTIEEW